MLQHPHLGLLSEEEVLRDLPLVVKVVGTIKDAAARLST